MSALRNIDFLKYRISFKEIEVKEIHVGKHNMIIDR